MTDASSHSTQHSADLNEPDPDFVKWLKENCVPIVGAVSGALVLCLVAHYGSATVDWARTKDFARALANFPQFLALSLVVFGRISNLQKAEPSKTD
jgi:hypothetical protein